MMVLFLATSGCSWFTNWAHVNDFKPVIAKPNKPVLELWTQEDLGQLPVELQGRFKRRDAKLKDCIERYRDVIDLYNTWAEEQNEKSGYGKTAVFKLKE